MRATVKKFDAHKESRKFPDVAAVAMGLQPSYPVYCLRPNVLEEAARRFINLFPGTVLYAVKCNPHPLVLDALYRGGIRHFDTASLPEIAQISETYHNATAYFMHPVKGRAVIQSAYTVYGVRHFVVDHESELEKVLAETGDEKPTIIVRLLTPESPGVLFHLSEKFGATPDHAAELVKMAAQKGCKVGLAFHVGSQCLLPEAYEIALDLVGEVIEKSGIEPACIDVGGGFPAEYLGVDVPPLESFIAAIRRGLKTLAVKPTTEIFAEPGRALVADGCSLLTQVQLRKDNQLYINDGIYGSLSEVAHAGIRLPARLIRLDGTAADEMQAYTINGPTCDSLDIIPGAFELPEDIREGDWIEIEKLGAYSNANASRFNGFFAETFVEIYDGPSKFGPPTGESPEDSK